MRCGSTVNEKRLQGFDSTITGKEVRRQDIGVCDPMITEEVDRSWEFGFSNYRLGI